MVEKKPKNIESQIIIKLPQNQYFAILNFLKSKK